MHTQVAALGAIQGAYIEEPNSHKELASKYYSKWSKSAREKKEVAMLWDKKTPNSKSRCLHCAMQIFVNNDCLLHLMNRNQFRVSYDIPDALHYSHEKGYLHCDLKSNNVSVCNQKGY